MGCHGKDNKPQAPSINNRSLDIIISSYSSQESAHLLGNVLKVLEIQVFFNSQASSIFI